MGRFLNPKNRSFATSVNSKIYVDKTMLIDFANSFIGGERPLIASSRPRRFEKTMAAKMLAAYYSKGCHSRELFEGLEISKLDSFDEHLNKYDVIFFDMNSMLINSDLDDAPDVIAYVQEQIIDELKDEFPNCVNDGDKVLPAVLSVINNKTDRQFIIIIDEWDCIFREEKNNKELQKQYIKLLRGLFKSTEAENFVALAYITGILPIKKYGT